MRGMTIREVSERVMDALSTHEAQTASEAACGSGLPIREVRETLHLLSESGYVYVNWANDEGHDERDTYLRMEGVVLGA